MVADAPVVGSLADFSSGVPGGRFESELVSARIGALDRDLPGQFVRLGHPNVRMMRELAGCSAILGLDVLRAFGRLRFLPR